MRTTSLILFFMALVLAGPGCTKVGPDYQRPELPLEIPSTYQHGRAKLTPPLTLSTRWWALFRDPQLNRLVEDVIRRNLEIKASKEKVKELVAELIIKRADQFPLIRLEGAYERQKRPLIGIVPTKTFTTRTKYYTLALPASYELDLWGRVKRAEEAALARLLEAKESRLTILQGIVAEAVALYFEIKAIAKRLKVARARIKSYEEELAVLEKRYARGLATLLDLTRTRRNLAKAKATLTSLRLELGVAQQELAVLAARYPHTQEPDQQEEIHFFLPTPVPPGLPSELLMQRPDIRRAEARLKALNAMVGVAKASRFPRISLTGSFGYTSNALRRLFEPTSELWGLAAGIVQPIFDAGRLKASQKVAEARYKQGVIDYAKTVLRAFREVEQALLAREELIKKRSQILEYLEQAALAEALAKSRYSRGLGDYLALLEARQRRYEAQEELILVELAIVTNRVALHRALGGAWE